MTFYTWQSELRTESERFIREKKGLTEQIAEAESQLEWARSEREEEVKKLSTERKILQDRLHDAEVQLSQLKTRKRDELKVNFMFLTAALKNVIF